MSDVPGLAGPDRRDPTCLLTPRHAWGSLRRQAVDRLRVFFTGDHTTMGVHGFGSIRTIADYECYAGIDFRAARFELLAPKLAETRVLVDLGALGLEPRDDYERFRVRLHDEECRIVHRADVIDPAILSGDVTTHVVEALVPEPVVTYSVLAKHPGGWIETTDQPAHPAPGHRAAKRP